MNKGGRSPDIVWQHFSRVEVGGKTYAKMQDSQTLATSRHRVNSIWSIPIPHQIYQFQFQIEQFQFNSTYLYMLYNWINSDCQSLLIQLVPVMYLLGVPTPITDWNGYSEYLLGIPTPSNLYSK